MSMRSRCVPLIHCVCETLVRAEDQQQKEEELVHVLHSFRAANMFRLLTATPSATLDTSMRWASWGTIPCRDGRWLARTIMCL